jgi:hypothetical protein
MQKVIKNSAKILINNTMLIQPLILYLLFSLTIANYILSKNIYPYSKIVLIISFILLTIAFTSGWLHINKYSVLTFNENDTKEEMAVKSIQNLKKFFEGVGKDFLKVTGLYLILTIIYTLFIFVTKKFCLSVYGEPTIISEIQKISNSSSQAELLNLFKNVSTQDIIIFSAWLLTTNFIVSVLNMFTLVSFAVLSFDNTNVLKTLWIALKFSLKNLFNLILIFLIMTVIYFAINLFVLPMGKNFIALVITTILFCMYLNYYLLLVFYFYYEKTKNNSNNRCEFIG